MRTSTGAPNWPASRCSAAARRPSLTCITSLTPRPRLSKRWVCVPCSARPVSITSDPKRPNAVAATSRVATPRLRPMAHASAMPSARMPSTPSPANCCNGRPTLPAITTHSSTSIWPRRPSRPSNALRASGRRPSAICTVWASSLRGSSSHTASTSMRRRSASWPIMASRWCTTRRRT